MTSEVKVDLIVEGKRLSCDKATLIANSEYFRAMFSSCMRESHASEIELKEESLQYGVVKLVVEFMDTGEIDVSKAEDLLHTACILQVPELVKSCASYLVQKVSDRNCLGFMLKADTLALFHLFNVSRKHALMNFPSVVCEDELLQLDKEELVDYLSDPLINCDGELQILLALRRWLDSDVSRKVDTEELLKKCFHPEDLSSVELSLLEKEIHSLTGIPEDFIRQCQNAMKCNQKPPYRSCPVSFLVVGMCEMTDKVEHATFCNTVYQLNYGEQTFNLITKISVSYPDPSRDIGYRSCVIGENLYITGGEEKLGRNTWRLDVMCLSQGCWSVVTQLPSLRRHHAICNDRQSFYLLGGFGRFRQKLSSIHQYNTVTDTWITLPDLPFPQVAPKVAMGTDQLFILCEDNAVHMLNLKSPVWTRLDLSWSGPTLFSFMRWYHDSLYVFVHPSEEQLQVIKCSVVKDGYNKTELHTFDRQISDVVIHGGKLFVFEGHYGDELVSYELSDFSRTSIVGHKPCLAHQSELLVLPKYPDFRK